MEAAGIARYIVGLARESNTLSRIRQRSQPHMVLDPGTAAVVRALLALMRGTQAPRSGTRVVFDVGTHMGYSCALFAEALPEAQVHTFERDAFSLAVARDLCASFGPRIVFHEGDAQSTLRQPELLQQHAEGVDVVFVDADKRGYRDYAEVALRYLRPGGLLLVDNALWRGEVVHESSTDPRASAVRDTNAFLAANSVFALLPVGDGLGLAVKC